MALRNFLSKNTLQRIFFIISINKVVQFLTYSDILMISGWGLINPILAVFFTDRIIGGSVAVAGLASTIYFFSKSILQVPVARFIDSKRGEWDDFWVMVIGSLLISLSAFLFVFVRYPWHIYLIQMVSAIGASLATPSWLAIFTRHIDKTHASLEWSLYYTTTDLASALTAGIGGFIASSMGYKSLFIIVGIASLLGTAFLMGVSSNLKRSQISGSKK